MVPKIIAAVHFTVMPSYLTAKEDLQDMYKSFLPTKVDLFNAFDSFTKNNVYKSLSFFGNLIINSNLF